MQFSPKLKKAMADIKAILDEHDIAGMVFLHTPGHGEYMIKINPSYSCASIDRGQLRVKCKAEDFGGDKQKQHQVMKDTCNLLSVLSDMPLPILAVLPILASA